MVIAGSPRARADLATELRSWTSEPIATSVTKRSSGSIGAESAAAELSSTRLEAGGGVGGDERKGELSEARDHEGILASFLCRRTSLGLAKIADRGEFRHVLPAALLLDLDGTLVDSETFHMEGIARFMAERGQLLSQEEKLFVIGHAWQEIYEFLRVEERIGMSLADLQAMSMVAKQKLEEEGHPGLQVLDGARELVALAVSLKIPVCIVSGSSRAEIEHALVPLGFADSLEFYYGAEDYSRGKPAPDGYLRAATTLGVVPEHCLVFEDSEAGIGSALAANMRVVATSAATPPAGEHGHQDHSGAHLRVSGLEGVDSRLLEAAMG